MDEQQYKEMRDILDDLKKKLLIVQGLAAVTLGFLLAVSVSRLF